MMMSIRLLIAASLLAAPALLFAGGEEEEGGGAAEGAAAMASTGKYSEAPELAARVAAGELPPVEERLPLEPRVLSAERNDIPPEDLNFEVGKYGGILRSVQPDPSWNPDIFVMNDESLLAAPGILADGIGGNVASSFEVSPDGRVFTLTLREGIKWSDGVPVTTEDVRFTYEDFLLNDQLTKVFPRWMRSASKSDGEPLKIEIIDDYTFRISFAERYDGFPAYLSIVQWKGYTEFVKPAHYLKQWHADYTPLADLEDEIAEEGLGKGEWGALFNNRDARNWDLTRPKALGFPVLNPWMLVDQSPTTSVYERNPYYFKVDSIGQQLPYINGLRSQVVADVEMSNLKVLAGEVDFLREDATLDKLDLYKENEDRAGYEIVLLDMHVSPTDPRLNLTYDDPVWRQVVGDVRFRTALSHAINRDEIIDAIYFGFATPSTFVPTAYDPALANRLLDEVGLDRRDAQGFRLGPDGKTFEIPFEIAMHATDMVPVTEMIAEYWKDVGLKTTMKTIEPGLQRTRRNANELQADIGWHHGPELWWGALWDFVPAGYGMAWHTWFQTAGAEGEEPPDDVKAFIAAMDRSIARSGAERQAAIDEVREIMMENVYIILNVEDVKYPLVVNKNLGNVPTGGFAIAANFAGEQLFFKN